MSQIALRARAGRGLRLASAGVIVTLALALGLLLTAAPPARAASTPARELVPRTVLQAATPPVQPLANPPLPLSCSGTFSLVFDTSGSFTQGNLNSVKADAKAFVAGVLAVDPSATFRIAHFATDSGVTLGSSSDLATIEAAIDAVPAVGGYTNWAAGITSGATGADHLIMLTDGNPNRPGSTTEVSDSAVAAAITAANAAKNAGAHLTVIGVDTSGTPPAGFDASSVMRAGWVASPADVYTTTVGLLPAILDQIAANCLTSIEVQKEVLGGDGSPGDFQLRIDGSNVDQGTAIEVDAGSHSIGELDVALYELVGIACIDEQQSDVPVVDGSIDVAEQQNVVCVVTNQYRGAPSIAIDKQVNGDDAEITVPVGTTVTYSWLVENTGNITLTNVHVDDDTHDVLDGDCGTLAPGETCAFDAEVELDSAGEITNVVTVTSQEGPTDDDEITVDVYQPTITLTKQVFGGDLAADAFQLTLDGGNVDQGAANAVSPGDHTIGEVAIEPYSLNVIACEDEHEDEVDVAGGQITIDEQRAVTCLLTNVFEGTPHVSIDKRVNGVDGPISITDGETVTYDWTVINDGDVVLHDVVVDDDTHDALDHACGMLAVGATCQWSASVTLSAGGVTNIATVTTAEEVSDSDAVTVTALPTTPPPVLAHLTVIKAGGEAGVDYDFRLTHGALDNVHDFSLASGESATMVLFQAADWQVVELNAPEGAVYSGTCSGPNVLPLDDFTCTVTNPTPPPPPEVLGSSLAIAKVLTSADPAAVGELVIFEVTVTATGDVVLTNVVLVDTFDSPYLEFVSASTACTLHEGAPDADHGTLECALGTMTPGSPGAPGSESVTVEMTFRAIAATPGRAVNGAVVSSDAGTAGPAEADVEIVEILGVQLPPAGDGSALPLPFPWALALATAAVAVVWIGVGREFSRRRPL